MSTPVAGNQFYTSVESNTKNNTMLKSTTLKVGGTAYINFLESKGAHHGGDLLVDGYLEVKDNNSVGSTFEKDLQVDGSTLLNGTLDVPNALSTLESLEVTNGSTLNGTLDVPNALSTLESLEVTNGSTLNGALDVPNALSTLESLEVTNGSTLNGLLTVNAGITRQTQEITAGTTLGASDSDELIYFNNVLGAATFQIRLPQVSASRGLKFRLTASDLVNVNAITINAFPGDTMKGTILNGAGTNAIVNGATVTAATTVVDGDFIEISTQGLLNTWYINGVSRVAGALS